MAQNPPASAEDVRDVSSTPGLGSSPGEGIGNLLQFSCLENPMGRRACGLQSIGSQRVKHNGSDLAHMHANGWKVANDRGDNLGFVICFIGLPRTSQLWSLGLAGSDIFHV